MLSYTNYIKKRLRSYLETTYLFVSFPSTLYVSEQDVKEAFLQYVSKKHLYRSKPAKHMKVQNIISLNTYRVCTVAL